ncbi:YraN family protein [Demequina sp. B12]|uniref:YraN family protein n=1 Tax=Demequina sp. B12 TaxID=2992757 RepID=UPI00237B9510|nr:YraN family protein [Demequina sp. B12]MDE0573413.1 YraN family protein [Demequina sp. B12]
MTTAQLVGRYGEDVACRWMEKQGWTVLERNWRCARGEIDAIALDRDTVVIAEVKTRRSTTAGTPQEAVTVRKVQRLRALAGMWLQHSGRTWREVRIDVIAVTVARAGAARIEHFKGVE